MIFCIGFLPGNDHPDRFVNTALGEGVQFYKNEHTIYELVYNAGCLTITNYRGPIKKKRALNAKPTLPIETGVYTTTTGAASEHVNEDTFSF